MSKRKGRSAAQKAQNYQDWRKIARNSPAMTAFNEDGRGFTAGTKQGAARVYNHPGNFSTGLNKKLRKLFALIGLIALLVLIFALTHPVFS